MTLPRVRRRLLATVVVTSAVVLSACGSAGSEAKTSTGVTSSTGASTVAAPRPTPTGVVGEFCTQMQTSLELAARNPASRTGVTTAEWQTYFTEVNASDAALQKLAPAEVKAEVAVMHEYSTTLQAMLVEVNYDVGSLKAAAVQSLNTDPRYAQASATLKTYLTTTCGITATAS